jgi:hypothetical protein
VWKQRQEIEEKKIRIKLEKAYEQEKSKVNLLFNNLEIVCHHEEVQSDLPRVSKKH